MAARSNYSQDYVDACRRRIDRLVATYGGVMSVARQRVMTEHDRERVQAFEHELFTNLVLVLPQMFPDLAGHQAGEKGSAAGEVQLIADALLHHDGRMPADSAVAGNPATSVLHHRPGDVVTLSASDFQKLAQAYFAAIETGQALLTSRQ